MLFQYPVGGERLVPVFARLESWGFQDLVLPFLLLFAIMFAILQRIKIFKTYSYDASGDKSTTKDTADRKINGILAAVISLLVVIPHVLGMVPPELDPVLLIAALLPGSVILLVALLLGLLIIGLTLGDKQKITPFGYLASIVVAIVFGGVVLTTIFPAIGLNRYVNDPNIQAIAIVILVMLLVIWFVTSEKKPKKLHERVAEWFEVPP